jgi:hypothetical protein
MILPPFLVPATKTVRAWERQRQVLRLSQQPAASGKMPIRATQNRQTRRIPLGALRRSTCRRSACQSGTRSPLATSGLARRFSFCCTCSRWRGPSRAIVTVRDETSSADTPIRPQFYGRVSASVAFRTPNRQDPFSGGTIAATDVRPDKLNYGPKRKYVARELACGKVFCVSVLPCENHDE